ncbi:MAG: PQQ-binding-like beta-propeller repeat protein [Ignavibacteriaceae bacterium]|nr:PQQ-binding-like beta-propeller repeat protein [Ignavibacteria bacterium]MBT8392353.1 PQQ-binding-like beta-propeller repeat protein [Ignavibacteria bacterium]NNJ53105.1 PQQ-binding-like beta-propeller repeat protein [Ignavibacteriaceae bacterium]NNL22223.1 PQQ-binding-like beta-propeller repeat protein [Ignavibacteriaceae bacterium]
MLRFSFLFLLFILSNPAIPQDNFVALITNPEVGANKNAQNLLAAVDSINQAQKVSHVVVLGNITANGIFDEFIWTMEILDGLSVPYSVVGGENDYLLSEGRGSEISLLWDDDKRITSNKNFSLVCLNTIIPEFDKKIFIDAETLDWYNDRISEIQSKRILFFSYYPMLSIETNLKFFENITDKKLFSFVSKKDRSNKSKIVNEGFYLNRKNGWGYSLISIKSDSLFIDNILITDSKKSELIKTNFSSVSFEKSSKTESKIVNQNVIWEKKYNRSTFVNSAFSGDKIFRAFKDGTVVYIDDSGKEKWSYQTNGRIYSSPIIEGDLLAVATNEGDLQTLNANTGSLVQVIGIGETISSEICIVDNKEDGGTTKAIVAGTSNGNLYCYNVYTLEPLWINQSANNGLGNRIISSIASADNKVLFQDFNGTLYCVSSLNGLLLWYWKPPVKNSNPLFKTNLIVKENNIYLIDTGGSLHCIDYLLGTEIWNIKNIDATGIVKTSKNGLILSTEKNKLLTISTKLGKVVNQITFSPELKFETITDFIVNNDNIIAGFSDGSVYKVKPKQKPKLIFKSSSAPIVSLSMVKSNLLIADYNGSLTLLNDSQDKK